MVCTQASSTLLTLDLDSEPQFAKVFRDFTVFICCFVQLSSVMWAAEPKQ